MEKILPFVHTDEYLISSNCRTLWQQLSKPRWIVQNCKSPHTTLQMILVHIIFLAEVNPSTSWILKHSNLPVELVLLHEVESFNTPTKTLQHKGSHSVHPLLQSSVDLHQIYRAGLNQQSKSSYITWFLLEKGGSLWNEKRKAK